MTFKINLALMPHPAFPPSSVDSVEVELCATDWDDVLLEFRIVGANVVLPQARSPARIDGLWKSTCFELFLKVPDLEPYYEFNFSPSGCWAAYAFDGYRTGMHDLQLAVDPHIHFDPDRPLALTVDLDLSAIPGSPMLASISAVIEEQDGTKSFWALAHPPGDRPDFHHHDCFVFEFPAARRT